jgi:hypothetical protein
VSKKLARRNIGICKIQAEDHTVACCKSGLDCSPPPDQSFPLVEIWWKFCGTLALTQSATHGMVVTVSRTVGLALVWVRTDRIRAAQAECDSVFDNSVERASRERTDSGISPKRSHKIGHCVLSGMQVVANTSLSSGWSWQSTFYPSVDN